MNEKPPYKLKPASEELIKLYTLMGEALCAVQLIEDALSHVIAMKHDIQHLISEDSLKFLEDMGLDTSRVKKEIERYYG